VGIKNKDKKFQKLRL